MASAEQLFSSCALDLVIPNSVVELPSVKRSRDADPWLEQLVSAGERAGAFFDEKLSSFLLVRFRDEALDQSTIPDGHSKLLLSLLNHLQVSLEAMYIPPSSVGGAPNGLSPAAPSRPGSAAPSAKSRALDLQLPMVPPQTPSPVPSTTEGDKKYVLSDGTLLKAFVWGEEGTETTDSFRLMWSTKESCWIAVYKLTVTVAYVRTGVPDPLLCLTASVTLRDKALAATKQRTTLTDLIKAAEPLPSLVEIKEDVLVSSPTDIHSSGVSSKLGTLDELNLLEGLPFDSPSGSGLSRLFLPTSRLPSSVRNSYSLPSITPASPISSTSPSARSLPVLRKSFRKSLPTMTGFHVRMRTVFIPHIYIPDDPDSGDFSQEASSEESTVVLSVEIESSGDSGTGFSVEEVTVSIGGDGARTRLIAWGEKGFTDASGIFPILMRPSEQYNLLYSVSFLRPAELDLLSSGSGRETGDFQRAVSIGIIGRPFFVADGKPRPHNEPVGLDYPTSPFLSRWNCMLDVTPRRNRDSQPVIDAPSSARNALPYPMSPFPPPSPHPQPAHDRLSMTSPQPSAVAGSQRRGPINSTLMTMRSDSLPNNRSSSPLSVSRRASDRLTPLGKVDSKQWLPGRPVSSGPLSPPLPPIPSGDQRTPTAAGFPPKTPAYPSQRQSAFTSRPNSVMPSFSQMTNVGRGADASRVRMSHPSLPQTPGPRLYAGAQVAGGSQSADFVVSVRLIGPEDQSLAGRTTVHKHIYSLDEFSLEIFVFNQSPHVRTLEASYPDKKAGDLGQITSSSLARNDPWISSTPGFTPLESRVRIGPLAQSACQSVRMHFLAILPGIHSVDNLILRDVDTGFETSLRSVMDFAVLSRDR